MSAEQPSSTSSRLYWIRVTAGLTAIELGRRLGMSRQRIYQIEGRGWTPTLETALRYAEALGVDPHEIDARLAPAEGGEIARPADDAGVALKRARIAAGLGISAVVRSIGRDYAWLYRIENGKQRPELTTVWRLAHAIGCDPHSIDPRLASTGIDEGTIAAWSEAARRIDEVRGKADRAAFAGRRLRLRSR